MQITTTARGRVLHLIPEEVDDVLAGGFDETEVLVVLSIVPGYDLTITSLSPRNGSPTYVGGTVHREQVNLSEATEDDILYTTNIEWFPHHGKRGNVASTVRRVLQHCRHEASVRLDPFHGLA